MTRRDGHTWAQLIADFRAGLFWAATSTLAAALCGWVLLAPAGRP